MEDKGRLDSLQETLFELMENISQVEESLEATKKEVAEMKTAIDSKLDSKLGATKADSKSQSKKVDSDLAKRFKKLESNINSVISSGALEVLSKKIDKKALIKKEIRRYQFMIMFILLLVAGGSGAFFYYNLATTQENLITFGAIIAVFLIALIVINSNLKLAISEEKRTPVRDKSSPDEIEIESHTLDMPDIDDLRSSNSEQPRTRSMQHRDISIRNTFED